MSITKISKRRLTETHAYVAPPTVSAPGLLQGGSDRTFQKLVFDLFTISARLEDVRIHVASRMAISPPQYSVLRAVAALQGPRGVSIGAIADHLNVSSAFITAQSRGLFERDLMHKREDATDRRVSRVSLTRKGEGLVDDIVEQVRPINDIFFGVLGVREFDALSAIVDKLVQSSRNAMIRIAADRYEASLFTRDRRSVP
jgi:DNA-binding MarR family transcriptional regulator